MVSGALGHMYAGQLTQCGGHCSTIGQTAMIIYNPRSTVQPEEVNKEKPRGI